MELILSVMLVFVAIIMVLLGVLVERAKKFFLLSRTVIDRGFMKKFNIVFDHLTSKNNMYTVSVNKKGVAKKELNDRSY